jgi:CDP-diglyceride synthetase
MKKEPGFNWVQFIAGAILGAPIGFSLWMSLPPAWTYSGVAGIACVGGMALLIGWLVSSGNRFWRSR